MLHAAAGPAPRALTRAMFAAAEAKPRRAVSPLGIPKSPSFHSGLDLVATSNSKRAESVSDIAKAFRFALFSQGAMDRVSSPPEARSPPAAAAAASPERPQPMPTDMENLMVQLPLFKGPIHRIPFISFVFIAEAFLRAAVL